jgi:hypothetical protein
MSWGCRGLGFEVEGVGPDKSRICTGEHGSSMIRKGPNYIEALQGLGVARGWAGIARLHEDVGNRGIEVWVDSDLVIRRPRVDLPKSSADGGECRREKTSISRAGIDLNGGWGCGG